ncbi:aldo/keto reductase [Corallococcus sp. 4LFB]|uniref:aldo/keto reductase n=1 Tax=Corallococcus sp. 4LFB TaxID=3383249 RepID=UPI00397565B7
MSRTLFHRDLDAGGNSRKNMLRAVEASLKRLRTDSIDRLTPAEEGVRAFDDLVRAGKLRYAGLSDVPSCYAARADLGGDARAHAAHQPPAPVLAGGRSLEHEYVPLARTPGLGITTWSPLGRGLLSGKYRPSEAGAHGDGRLTSAVGGQQLGPFTERNWRIVAALEQVSRELGRDMSQVALNRVATQPGVGSVTSSAPRTPGSWTATSRRSTSRSPPGCAANWTRPARRPCRSPHGMFSNPYQLNQHGHAAVGDKPAGYSQPVFTGTAPRVG